jgi:FkbM family methyltransferase
LRKPVFRFSTAAAAQPGADCQHCPPGGGREWPVCLDERNLCPGVPGKRFNSSLIAWGGGYLLAFRNGWRGSEIFLTPLDARFRPSGAPVKLDLRHPGANYGREDPRLFFHAGRLHVSFIGVVGGNRIRHTNQLYARIGDGLRVEAVFHPHFPGRREWEKNWQFFSHGGELYAVYSVAPHRVLRVRGDAAALAYETATYAPWVGGELRGGAAPVLAGGEWWCFFHDRVEPPGRRRAYRLGLYTFEDRPPFRALRITPEPVLAADPATNRNNYADVVFPCGAVRDGDRWVVSCGVHDRWTELHAFGHADLDRRLVSIGPPPGWSAHPWPAIDGNVFADVVMADEYRLGDADLSAGTVVDVGAHVGSFAHAARRKGATAIHCYEPNPGNLPHLRANAAGATVFAEAVGGAPGRATLLPNPDPDNTGGWRATDDADGPITVTPLDDVLARAAAAHPSGRVSFLKLDCEGCELAALGSSAKLDIVDRAAGEWHGSPELVKGALERAGFAVTMIPTQGGRGLFFARRAPAEKSMN